MGNEASAEGGDQPGEAGGAVPATGAPGSISAPPNAGQLSKPSNGAPGGGTGPAPAPAVNSSQVKPNQTDSSMGPKSGGPGPPEQPPGPEKAKTENPPSAPPDESKAPPASYSVPQIAPMPSSKLCPVCKTAELKETKDSHTCTQCQSTVCNQCGFNPNPHLKEVQEWLCLNCQMQRALGMDMDTPRAKSQPQSSSTPPASKPQSQTAPPSPAAAQPPSKAPGAAPSPSMAKAPSQPDLSKSQRPSQDQTRSAGSSPSRQPPPPEQPFGRLFGFGASLLSQASNLISETAPAPPPPAAKTPPKQPENKPKVSCPLCQTELNVGVTKDPPNYKQCTECHAQVCNTCGFNPAPDLTETKEWLCLTCQTKRAKSRGSGPPPGAEVSDPLPSTKQGAPQYKLHNQEPPAKKASTQLVSKAEIQKQEQGISRRQTMSKTEKGGDIRAPHKKGTQDVKDQKKSSDLQKSKHRDKSTKSSTLSLSDTGYSSDGISSSQSEITGVIKEEGVKLTEKGISNQGSVSGPSEITKLESSMRPLLESRSASGQGQGKDSKSLADTTDQQRPQTLSISKGEFDSDGSDDLSCKLRHDYVEDSSESGLSPLPTRKKDLKNQTDEESMRRQILEMSADEQKKTEGEGQPKIKRSHRHIGDLGKHLTQQSNSFEEDAKGTSGGDIMASQGGLRRFKTIELNNTNSDLREPELEMESLTGSPEERSRGEYSSTLPATTPSYTSGTSPTSVSSLEEDSDSSPSRRQKLEEAKQQRKARHRSHGPLLPTIEDSSEEEELREEEELLREQEKMRDLEQQRIRSTARKTKRDKEELRAQRLRERSKTPPSNLSPIEDASPTEELRQAAEMEELHRSSCSEYSPSMDSEAEMSSRLPGFISAHSPTNKSVLFTKPVTVNSSTSPISSPTSSQQQPVGVPVPENYNGNVIDLRKPPPIIVTDYGMDLTLTSLASDSRRYSLNSDRFQNRHTAVQPLIMNLITHAHCYGTTSAPTTATMSKAVVYRDSLHNYADLSQGLGSPVYLSQIRPLKTDPSIPKLEACLEDLGIQQQQLQMQQQKLQQQQQLVEQQLQQHQQNTTSFARYNLANQVQPLLLKKDLVVSQTSGGSMQTVSAIPKVSPLPPQPLTASVSPKFPPGHDIHGGIALELKNKSTLMNISTGPTHVMMTQLDEGSSSQGATVTQIMKKEDLPPPPAPVLDLTGQIRSENQVACCDVVYQLPFAGSCPGPFHQRGQTDTSDPNPTTEPHQAHQHTQPANMQGVAEPYNMPPPGQLPPSMSVTNLSNSGLQYYQRTHPGDLAVDWRSMKQAYEAAYLGMGVQYGSYTDLRHQAEVSSPHLPLRRYGSLSNISEEYGYPSRDMAAFQESNLAQYSATTAREINRMCAALNSMDQFGNRYANTPELLQYGAGRGGLTGRQGQQQGLPTITANQLYGLDRRPTAHGQALTNLLNARHVALRALYLPAMRTGDGMIYSTINTPIASTLPITTQPSPVVNAILRGVYRPYPPSNVTAVPLASLTRLPHMNPRMPLSAQGPFQYPTPNQFPTVSPDSIQGSVPPTNTSQETIPPVQPTVPGPTVTVTPAEPITDLQSEPRANAQTTAMPAQQTPVSQVPVNGTTVTPPTQNQVPQPVQQTQQTQTQESLEIQERPLSQDTSLSQTQPQPQVQTQPQVEAQPQPQVQTQPQPQVQTQVPQVQTQVPVILPDPALSITSIDKEKEKEEERLRKQQEHLLQLERERIELEKIRQLRLQEELERDRLQLQRHREKEQLLMQREIQELQSIKQQVIQQQQAERESQLVMQREQLAQQKLQLDQIQSLQHQLQQQLEEQKRQKAASIEAAAAAAAAEAAAASAAAAMAATAAQTAVQDVIASVPPQEITIICDQSGTVIPENDQSSQSLPCVDEQMVNAVVSSNPLPSSASDLPQTNSDNHGSDTVMTNDSVMTKQNLLPHLNVVPEEPVKRISDSSVQTDDEDDQYMSRHRTTRCIADSCVQTDDEDQGEWDSSKYSKHSEVSTEPKSDVSKMTSSIAVQTISDSSCQTEPDELNKVSPAIHITTPETIKVELLHYISAPERTEKGESLACQTEPEVQAQGVVAPQVGAPSTVSPYTTSLQLVGATPTTTEKKKPDPLDIGLQEQSDTQPPPKSPQVLYSPVSPLSPHRILESSFTSSEKLNKAHVTPQKKSFSVDSSSSHTQETTPAHMRNVQRSMSDPKPLSPTLENASKATSLYQNQTTSSSLVTSLEQQNTRKVKRSLPITPPQEPPLPTVTPEIPHTYIPEIPHTYTPEISHTYTPEISHTYTPEKPHTYTPEIPHTYTPEIPCTYTPEIPQTNTPEIPHTYTPEIPHTYTPEIPHTYTPEIPHTYTPEIPHTFNPEMPHTVNSSSVPRVLTHPVQSVTKEGLLNELKAVEQESTKLRKQQAELEEEEKEIDAKLRCLELGITQRKETMVKERERRELEYLRNMGNTQEYIESEINNIRLAGVAARTFDGNAVLPRPSTAPLGQFNSDHSVASQYPVNSSYVSYPYPQSQSKPAQPPSAAYQQIGFQTSQYPTPLEPQPGTFQPHPPQPYQTQGAFHSPYETDIGLQQPNHQGFQPAYPGQSLSFQPQPDVLSVHQRQTLLTDLEQKLPTNYEIISNPPVSVATSGDETGFSGAYSSPLTNVYRPYCSPDQTVTDCIPSPTSGFGNADIYATNLEQNIPRNYVMIDDISELTKDNIESPDMLRTGYGSENVPRGTDYLGGSEDPYGRSTNTTSYHQKGTIDIHGHLGTTGSSGSSYYYKDYKYSSRNLGMSSQKMAPAVSPKQSSKHRKQGMEQISKFSPIEEARDAESDLSYTKTTSTGGSCTMVSRTGVKKNIYDHHKYYGSRECLNEEDRLYSSGRSRSSGYGRDSVGHRSKSYERDAMEQSQRGTYSRSGRPSMRPPNSEEESLLSPVGRPMGMGRISDPHDVRNQYGSSHSLPDVQNHHIRDMPKSHVYKPDDPYLVDDMQCAVSDSEAYHLGQEETDWFEKPREARSDHSRHHGSGGHSSSGKRSHVKHTYHDYDEPPEEHLWSQSEYGHQRLAAYTSSREHRHRGSSSGRHPSSRHPSEDPRSSRSSRSHPKNPSAYSEGHNISSPSLKRSSDIRHTHSDSRDYGSYSNDPASEHHRSNQWVERQSTRQQDFPGSRQQQGPRDQQQPTQQWPQKSSIPPMTNRQSSFQQPEAGQQLRSQQSLTQQHQGSGDQQPLEPPKSATPHITSRQPRSQQSLTQLHQGSRDQQHPPLQEPPKSATPPISGRQPRSQQSLTQQHQGSRDQQPPYQEPPKSATPPITSRHPRSQQSLTQQHHGSRDQQQPPQQEAPKSATPPITSRQPRSQQSLTQQNQGSRDQQQPPQQEPPKSATPPITSRQPTSQQSLTKQHHGSRDQQQPPQQEPPKSATPPITSRQPRSQQSLTQQHQGSRDQQPPQQEPPKSGTPPTSRQPRSQQSLTQQHQGSRDQQPPQQEPPKSGTPPITSRQPRSQQSLTQQHQGSRDQQPPQQEPPKSGTPPITSRQPRSQQSLTQQHQGSRDQQPPQQEPPKSGTPPTSRQPRSQHSLTQQHQGSRDQQPPQQEPPKSGTPPTSRQPRSQQSLTQQHQGSRDQQPPQQEAPKSGTPPTSRQPRSQQSLTQQHQGSRDQQQPPQQEPPKSATPPKTSRQPTSQQSLTKQHQGSRDQQQPPQEEPPKSSTPPTTAKQPGCQEPCTQQQQDSGDQPPITKEPEAGKQDDHSSQEPIQQPGTTAEETRPTPSDGTTGEEQPSEPTKSGGGEANPDTAANAAAPTPKVSIESKTADQPAKDPETPATGSGSKKAPAPGGTGSTGEPAQPPPESESVFSKLLQGSATEQAGKLGDAVSGLGKKFMSFW